MGRESLLPLSRERRARRSFELRSAEGFSAAAAAADETDVEVLDRPQGWTWNQVGILYDTLRDALSQLPEAAFLPDPPDGEADLFQSGADDWGASESPDPPSGVKVFRAVDKASALSAVAMTALQGEGAGAASLEFSHFMRLLLVYRELRDTPGPWDPVLPVAMDPNVDDPPNETTITHPITRQWADLFNVRYRTLLTSLSHGL